MASAIGGGLSLPIALLIGASLSATDPVSVIALFRELGASQRLTLLMEGESLFNDGVAVVAFGLLVGLPLGVMPSTPLPDDRQFFSGCWGGDWRGLFGGVWGVLSDPTV